MRRINLLCLTLALVVVLSACAQAAPEPVTYTIEMTEYAFTPATIEVQVGQEVTIHLVNKGALEHEIMFGKNVMMMENRPDGYQHDLFAEAGVEPTLMNMEEMGAGGHGGTDHTGFMVTLKKTGDENSLTFTATKEMVGEWEMGCFALEGVHYTSGMVGKLIVKP